MYCEFSELLQKHSTKSMPLQNPNKGSNCERKILAYKKKKNKKTKKQAGPYGYFYIKNNSVDCFIRFEVQAGDILSVSL